MPTSEDARDLAMSDPRIQEALKSIPVIKPNPTANHFVFNPAAKCIGVQEPSEEKYPNDPCGSGLKTYIGTKIIQGQPMTKADFYAKIKHDTNNMCEQADGYYVRYEDGYESWSPKVVFERCHREITPSEKALIIR